MEEKKCVCETENLEQDDWLYKMRDWDRGIEFAYIRGIKYCPICGKLLPEGR